MPPPLPDPPACSCACNVPMRLFRWLPIDTDSIDWTPTAGANPTVDATANPAAPTPTAARTLAARLVLMTVAIVPLTAAPLAPFAVALAPVVVAPFAVAPRVAAGCTVTFVAAAPRCAPIVPVPVPLRLDVAADPAFAVPTAPKPACAPGVPLAAPCAVALPVNPVEWTAPDEPFPAELAELAPSVDCPWPETAELAEPDRPEDDAVAACPVTEPWALAFACAMAPFAWTAPFAVPVVVASIRLTEAPFPPHSR